MLEKMDTSINSESSEEFPRLPKRQVKRCLLEDFDAIDENSVASSASAEYRQTMIPKPQESLEPIVQGTSIRRRGKTLKTGKL